MANVREGLVRFQWKEARRSPSSPQRAGYSGASTITMRCGLLEEGNWEDLPVVHKLLDIDIIIFKHGQSGRVVAEARTWG